MLVTIAIFIFTLLFLALDQWDKSQDGRGLRGIFKIFGCMGKVLVAFCGGITLLLFMSAFSMSDFWTGMFDMLLVPSTDLICRPLVVLIFFSVILMLLKDRLR